MSKRLTQTEKLQQRNAKANLKHRQDLQKNAELHEKIRRGEITAGEALRSLVKK